MANIGPRHLVRIDGWIGYKTDELGDYHEMRYNVWTENWMTKAAWKIMDYIKDFNSTRDYNIEEDKMVKYKVESVCFLTNEMDPFIDSEQLKWKFDFDCLDDDPYLCTSKLVGKRIHEYYFLEMQDRLGYSDHWNRNLYPSSDSETDREAVEDVSPTGKSLFEDSDWDSSDDEMLFGK